MRKQKTIINILSGIGGQIFTQLLGFVVRTIFIYTLGREYLGINGLFTNILSLLSLAELGVGSAITYYLYKPLSENNHSRINAYMNFYKKVYTAIGVIVIIFGLAVIPFLDVIIKDMPDINSIYLIYILFLLNTGVSYFFSYYITLLIADQKQYKTIITTQIVSLLRSILQILVLFFLRNYILYLVIMVVSTVVNNIVIAKIARKEYSTVLNSKSESLSKNDINELRKYISATFLHKIGTIVVFNTDNLLISSFVGISYVGIVSNYYLILQILTTFIGQIFNGMVASIGNLNSEKNIEMSYRFYKILDFFVFTLYTVCCIVLFNVINPFIDIWIGSDYILATNITFLIIINFYLTGLRRTNLIFIDTMGLQWITRKKPIFEATANFIISVVLLKYYGLIGVFLGTFFSTILCSFFYEPVILFKYGFKKNVYMNLLKYLKFFCIAGLCYFLCSIINIYTPFTGFANIIWVAMSNSILTVSIIIFLFWKSDEVKYFKLILLSFSNQISKKS